jgi:DNA-binding GntR family transcriptional regulator
MADLVFNRLYTAIIRRELPPGSQLVEQSLADQLEVSKTPIREAILRLRQIGMVEPDGRRGMRVVKMSFDDLRQATELRAVLEGFAAGRAAELATKAQARRVQRAAEDSLDATEEADVEAFHRADRLFHESIGELAHNVRMKQCIDDTSALIHTLMARDLFPTPEVLQDCAKSHVRIGEAILRKDAATARTEMERHIWRVHELMLTQDLHLEGESHVRPFRPSVVA